MRREHLMSRITTRKKKLCGNLWIIIHVNQQQPDFDEEREVLIYELKDYFKVWKKKIIKLNIDILWQPASFANFIILCMLVFLKYLYHV